MPGSFCSQHRLFSGSFPSRSHERQGSGRSARHSPHHEEGKLPGDNIFTEPETSWLPGCNPVFSLDFPLKMAASCHGMRVRLPTDHAVNPASKGEREWTKQ